MIRWLVIILLVLLLGAATTVLVALACARWSRPMTFSMGVLEHPDVDSPEMKWGVENDLSGSVELIYQVDPADIDPSPPHQRAARALARRIPIHYPNIASENKPAGDINTTGRDVSWTKAPPRVNTIYHVDSDVHVFSPGHPWVLQPLSPEMPAYHPHSPFKNKSVGDIITGRGVLWMKATPFEEFRMSRRNWTRYNVIEKQYGWPLLCLSSGDHKTGFVWTAGNPDVVNWAHVMGGLVSRYYRGSYGSGDMRLDTPRVILWPGFIGNTLLFSAPWLLGIIAVIGVRSRWRRWWRGRCPVCGYDLRGGPARGCPECGWGREA